MSGPKPATGRGSRGTSNHDSTSYARKMISDEENHISKVEKMIRKPE